MENQFQKEVDSGNMFRFVQIFEQKLPQSNPSVRRTLPRKRMIQYLPNYNFVMNS